MAREIDPKVTAKALRKLKRTAKAAEAAGLIADWEEEFFSSVEERLETFGSAFHDPEKGLREEALSVRQQQVLARLRSEARKASRVRSPSSPELEGLEPAGLKPSRKSTSVGGKAPALGMQTKVKAKRFTPRIRQVDDHFPDECTVSAKSAAPVLPTPSMEIRPVLVTGRMLPAKASAVADPDEDNIASSATHSGDEASNVIAFPLRRRA
jgi:hypothetical protein